MLSKYFKPGQKLQIHPLSTGETGERHESLTAYLNFCGADYLDLALPYQTPSGEEYPFHTEMKLEIKSQAFGLGIKGWGHFAGFRGSDLIRVQCQPQLQIFQQRVLPRVDIPVGLRYAKGKGNLRSLRQKWEKNLTVLERAPDSERITEFPYCPVNLSAGGIRFNFRDQAEVADLCLLLMELEPRVAPVCALAEVVWMRPAQEPGWKTAGLQFIHIRKDDQHRIKTFVERSNRQLLQQARDEEKKREAS